MAIANGQGISNEDSCRGSDVAFAARSSGRADERVQRSDGVCNQAARSHADLDHLAQRLAAVQPGPGRKLYGLRACRSALFCQRAGTRIRRPIAKTVPELKHVVLWRGIISLSRDISNSDIDLLASRNRLLVRADLHPALQYLLLEAMREVHSKPGPFNRLGEFPAEQPNDLPLSPTAEAFYRGGGRPSDSGIHPTGSTRSSID